jgi:hypothetical protein
MKGRTIWLFMAVLVLGACGPGVEPLAPTGKAAEVVAMPRIDARAVASLSDALTRVMPGLSGPAAESLSARLASLEDAMRAGDRRAAARAMSDVRRAIAAYAISVRRGGEADLDVIQLAIAAVGGEQITD